MLSPWIAFTLGAATVQSLRFALHKRLSLGGLSDAGSSFARFAFGAPLALLAALVWLTIDGAPLPALAPGFWSYAGAAGLSQILATTAMVALFRARNLAVGIALMKTTVVQTAILGLLVLSEPLSVAGWAAVSVSVVGVGLLSIPPETGGGFRIAPRTLILGLVAGALFAVAAIGVRGATLAVAADAAVTRSIVTLSIVTAAQTAGLGLWLAVAQPGQLSRVWAARRTGALIGAASILGSFCWFSAYTLERAAYVQALGQVEVALSILAGALFFGERVSSREVAGIVVLTISIVLLILAG
ncbi:DMT family transporter [Roseivivax marinus]|uniref:DMT family transporter n=1 Tax=Roseivivax marinus TaxID=1379903 RepID=UPI00273E649B|nr:DMT family transporter [Roseivivax marinus]